MLKKINQCDIYVGLWCIYMLQEVLYPPGIINRFIQLIMLMWGIVAVLKYLTSYEDSPIMKSTFILIIMYTIYGVYHIMFGDVLNNRPQYLYLQESLNSLVPIFLFYYFATKGVLTSERIRYYLPVLILICVLLYFKNESQVLLQTNKDEITNNIGYMFITLIPFLFFYCKIPILQYIFMSVIFVFVIMGMKRGAIFIGALSLIILLYSNIKASSRWARFTFMILSIIFLLGAICIFNNMMDSSEYFMLRVEDTLEGNSSNRDVIYSNLLNVTFLESRPLFFYFGRGADSTIAEVGALAHQDWLETFCNNGLLGVIILFSFFYTFAKNVWISKMLFPKMMYYSFATLLIIVFTKTIFSMSIQSLDISESMLIGYFAFAITKFNQGYECHEEF